MQPPRGSGDAVSGNVHAQATASIAGHVARVANGCLSDADTEAFDAYDEAFLEDPGIRRIARRVRFEFSDVLTQYYPAWFATGVRMHMNDGTARSSVVVDSVGTPARPLTIEQILAKGEGLAAHGHAASIRSECGRRGALQGGAAASRASRCAMPRWTGGVHMPQQKAQHGIAERVVVLPCDRVPGFAYIHVFGVRA